MTVLLMDKRTGTARAHESGERSAKVVPASEMQQWPKRYSWIFLAGIVVVGVLVVFAYLPGLHGSFCYDDFRSITQNRMLRMTNIDWESFRLLHTGPSGDRPVSLFSFALHYYFGLTEPWHFRLVNIAIHVLVAAAVGLVTRRVLLVVGMDAGRALFTCLGVVSLWALHPIQLTAVTYVVQRMTSLGTLFFWLSFYFYLVARTPPGPGTVRRRVACVAGVISLVLFLLGFLSKPHVAILPAMVVTTELLLFRSDGRFSRREWTVLVAGLVGTVVLIVATQPEWVERTLRWATVDLWQPVLEARGGTPFHRLISEPRVMFLYLSLFFFPLWSRFSLFWSIEPSHELFTPPQTSLAIAALVGASYLVFRWRRSRPLVAWALACFLLGHVIEGTVIPLYLVFEHRMYLPSVFLLIGCAGLMWDFVDQQGWKGRRFAVSGAAIFLVTLASLFANTYWRNAIWGDSRSLFLSEIKHNPGNYQLKVNYADYLLSRRPGLDSDEGVKYSRALITSLERLDRTRDVKIRLKKLNSNLAVYYIRNGRDMKRGLTYLLAAAQYGYTPTILFNLGSFYFYAKVQGNQDYLETLQRAGYDGDKKMLGFLETSYRTGRQNWFYTANLLNAYIYMLSKDPSNVVYAERAQNVLGDNRPRFAGHEDKLRALNAYETRLRETMAGGGEDR